MCRMEIHPGDGGEDAEAFAAELAAAVAKFTGRPEAQEGRVHVLERL